MPLLLKMFEYDSKISTKKDEYELREFAKDSDAECTRRVKEEKVNSRKKRMGAALSFNNSTRSSVGTGP